MRARALATMTAIAVVSACGGGGSGGVSAGDAGQTGSTSSSTGGTTTSSTGGSSTGGSGGSGGSTGGTAAPTAQSLRMLTTDQAFSGPVATLQYYVGGTSHSAKTFDLESVPSLSFFAADSSYRFNVSTNRIETGSEETRDFKISDATSSSNARYAIFRNSTSLLSVGQVFTLQLFKASASNDQLQTSYASFGSYLFERSGRFGDTDVDFRAFAYGYPDTESAIPTTGVVIYRSVVAGQAGPVETTINEKYPYDVTGQLVLTVDFGARTMTGAVTLTGTSRRDGSVIPFGTITLSQPQAQSALASFSGTAGQSGGSFRGFFAGASAAELAVAATFSIPNAVQTPVYNEPVTYRFAIAGAATH